jgi:hypothetical protein
MTSFADNAEFFAIRNLLWFMFFDLFIIKELVK